MKESTDKFTLETAFEIVLGKETDGKIMPLTEQLNKLSTVLDTLDTPTINIQVLNKEDSFLTNTKLVEEARAIYKNIDSFKNEFVENFKLLVEVVKKLETQIDSMRTVLSVKKENNLSTVINKIQGVYDYISIIHRQLEIETKNMEALKTDKQDFSIFNSDIVQAIINATALHDILNRLSFSVKSKSTKELNDRITGASLTNLVAQNNNTFSNRPDVRTRATTIGLAMNGMFNPNATIGRHAAERLGDQNVRTNRQTLTKALEHDFNYTGQKMRAFGKGLGAGAANFVSAAGRFVWQIGLITAAMKALEFTIKRSNATEADIAMEQAADAQEIEAYYRGHLDKHGKGILQPISVFYGSGIKFGANAVKDLFGWLDNGDESFSNTKTLLDAYGVYKAATNPYFGSEGRIQEIIEEMSSSEKEGKTGQEIRKIAEKKLKEEAKGKLNKSKEQMNVAFAMKHAEIMKKAESEDNVLTGTMNNGYEVRKKSEIFTSEDVRRVLERHIEKQQKSLENVQYQEKIEINEGILRGFNENDPAMIVLRKGFIGERIKATQDLLDEMEEDYKWLLENAKETKYNDYLVEEYQKRSGENPEFDVTFKTPANMPEDIKNAVREAFEKDLADGVISIDDLKARNPGFEEFDMNFNLKKAELSDYKIGEHQLALKELARKIEELNRNLSILRSEGEVRKGSLLLGGHRELSAIVREAEMMTLLEEYNERSQAIRDLEAKRQELLSRGLTDDAQNLYEQLKGLESQNIDNLLSQRELKYKAVDNILDLGNYDKNIKTLQHEIQRNKLIASGIQSDSPYITQVNIRMYREMIKLLGDTVTQLRAQIEQWSGDEEKSRQLNLQILEHQAEQSRYMASIQEELTRGGATFNLPDGIIPITQYDSLTSSGTHRYMTVQSGNVQINIMVDKMTGNEQDLERLAAKTAREIGRNRGINVADQLSLMNQRSGHGIGLP